MAAFDELMVFSKTFSLVIFFLLFCGILAWVFLPRHKKRYEQAGRMILDEDDDRKDGQP